MKRLLVFVLLLGGCGPEKERPVVVSLLGKEYFEPKREPAAQAKLDSNLVVAKKNFEADPSEENYIWYGRRTGYLLRLDDAIKIFTEGLEKYPDSYRLLRHRGHRYVTQRKFDLAIADLQKAEQLMAGKPLEVEPDGAPNKLNIPLSTTQFNVFYHLALAHYLKRDYKNAESVWNKCLAVCENDDSRVAVQHWLFMTLAKQRKLQEAADLVMNISDSLKLIENDEYYQLIKFYKGGDGFTMYPPMSAIVSSASFGYGMGNFLLTGGDTARSLQIFEGIVATDQFAAFGFIASEVELASWSPKLK